MRAILRNSCLRQGKARGTKLRNRRSRGVSLLEIIIAMQCMAILLVMLCRVLPLARRQTREADCGLRGAVLCQNALEEYMTVPLSQWPRDPVSVEGEPYKVRLEALPWEGASELRLARATLLLGEEEQYRLETAVVYEQN